MKQEDVLAIIRHNFVVGQVFSAKDLYAFLAINIVPMNYFLTSLKNKGELEKLARNRWALPISVEHLDPKDQNSTFEMCLDLPSVTNVLRISLKEKEILQIIFEMDLKSKEGKSRFGLDHLKSRLSKEQQFLLPELLPKLKSVGILCCLGEGKGQERIMEMDDALFLEYSTGESMEITLFSNTEIDEKINLFVSQIQDQLEMGEEINSEIEKEATELQSINSQIVTLETKRRLIEENLQRLKEKASRLNTEEYPKDFIESLSKMAVEQRRSFFQKIIG